MSDGLMCRHEWFACWFLYCFMYFEFADVLKEQWRTRMWNTCKEQLQYMGPRIIKHGECPFVPFDTVIICFEGGINYYLYGFDYIWGCRALRGFRPYNVLNHCSKFICICRKYFLFKRTPMKSQNVTIYPCNVQISQALLDDRNGNVNSWGPSQ